IMELDAVDQVEGVSQPVVRDLPALGEQTNDPGRTRLVFDQTLVDVVDCAHRAGLEPVVRIERANIGHVRYAQYLLRVDCRRRTKQTDREHKCAQAEGAPGELIGQIEVRQHSASPSAWSS